MSQKEISIKGNSFWVKTVKQEKDTQLSLFGTLHDAVMSFKSMEEAMTQDMSIAEFKFDQKKSEWGVTGLSWKDIAKARLEGDTIKKASKKEG